ncbi:hypothetical protein [Pseudoalteromonas sp. PPB1]|uniref:hypothetical protein n=1 Tax=Pseudoalteromonas sp. PPB1 TaxID=2756136 RepID=UPI0018917D79|nr:hypothetical protein [Pseudoalteromonas sp. PPB1]
MKIAFLFIVLLTFTSIYQNFGIPLEVECSSVPDKYVVLRLDTESGGYFSKFFKFTRVEFQPSGVKLEQGIHTKFFASRYDMEVNFTTIPEMGRELLSVQVGDEIYDLGVISNQCSHSIRVLMESFKVSRVYMW